MYIETYTCTTFNNANVNINPTVEVHFIRSEKYPLQVRNRERHYRNPIGFNFSSSYLNVQSWRVPTGARREVPHKKNSILILPMNDITISKDLYWIFATPFHLQTIVILTALEL